LYLIARLYNFRNTLMSERTAAGEWQQSTHEGDIEIASPHNQRSHERIAAGLQSRSSTFAPCCLSGTFDDELLHDVVPCHEVSCSKC
jgi:hypothetical protein